MTTDFRTDPTRMTDMSTGTRGGTGAGRTMSIVGFVCAALALFFVPIVFGPAAIVLGILAYRKGDRLGVWAAVAGVVGLVGGIALGAWVMSNANTTT